jgi:acyl-CoA reductase-like NAD-dependent aldehyde dehydrogenase
MDPTLIARHRGDFLWGSFFQAGTDGLLESTDPSTGLLLDRVPWRVGAVQAAARDAEAALPAWTSLPLLERFAKVREVRDFLQARQGALAAMAAREMGKMLWEAELECSAAVRALDLFLEEAERVLLPAKHPNTPGEVRRRPVGTVAVLTPFPYPIFGALQLLIPVLLGGNAVIWKPSSLVPLTSQKLAEVFDSARLPRGVFSMVQGPRDPIGAQLIHHPWVDMLVGAGDPWLGDALREAAQDGRRHWSQGGGKGWALVCADADLDRAAYEVVTSAFLTTGQRANATSRVLVEKRVARAFLKRVVTLTSTLRIAAPTDPRGFCGPLASGAARRRFHLWLKDFADRGIEFPVEGGTGQLPSQLRRRGQCYVAPAIALVEGGLPHDAPQPEDVEGPLLVATLVDRAEDAAQTYNGHPYGLAASVFTKDPNRFEAIAAILSSGAVNWNRGTIVASARFPNAGLRRSGQGAEGNGALLLACTWPQSILMATRPFDPAHRVPGMGWPGDTAAEAQTLHAPEQGASRSLARVSSPGQAGEGVPTGSYRKVP